MLKMPPDLESALPSERRNPFSLFRLTDEEALSLARWGRWMAAGFVLLVGLTVAFAKSDYFREQVHLKQARALIEKGGYAYCAIWGDRADPFQLMSPNSPNLPRWRGDRMTDGAYLMTFSYRRSGQVVRHQWKVDLEGKLVMPVDDMSAPIRNGETPDQMQCTDR